jgi:GTP cyclohydrolase II
MTELQERNIIDPKKECGPVKLPLNINGVDVPFELWYFDFDGDRWVAAFTGDIFDGKPLPLRIESACLFGHVFHSNKCDCGYQLDEAFRRIAELKRGMVIYAIDADARGLGIEAHFQIYVMRQVENLDTDQVYKRLNSPVDARTYEPVVYILNKFGIKNINLLSNNRSRLKFLKEMGFEVVNEKLEAKLNVHNMATLMLEKEDIGYMFSFKTHADWLEPLQAEVDGHLNKHKAQLVLSTEKLHAEYVDELNEWNVARELAEIVNENHEQSVERVIYLSDYPRVDELPVYQNLGASIVVVPFAVIPQWLKEAGQKHNIHVQDWERRNKYKHPRPQWNLIHQIGKVDVYRQEDKIRYVFTDKDESKLKKLKEALSNLAVEIKVNQKHIPWLETSLLEQLEQLEQPGLEAVQVDEDKFFVTVNL